MAFREPDSAGSAGMSDEPSVRMLRSLASARSMPNRNDARSRRRSCRSRVYEGGRGCFGSRRWPSTTAVATSTSLRFALRAWSRSISKALVSSTR